MKKKIVSGIVVLFSCIGGGVPASGQQPPYCAQNQFCLFNQEATASDPATIRKYSRELVDLILPNQWTYAQSSSGERKEFEHEILGEDYAAKLAGQLAQAEQMARTGNARFVPEASVVKAFNDLMEEVAAPADFRTNEASVHEFRAHAASIKAFPALLSANKNGSNCNPGEAMFLLYLLIYNDGHLSERLIDWAVEMEEGGGKSPSAGSFMPDVPRPNKGARVMISDYSSRHRRSASIRLFDGVSRALGL